MSFDVQKIRAQFPILEREINGYPLAYLDNAASAQKPLAVINALSHQMSSSYANVHRGLHTMANETTEAYEGARAKVAAFLGAPKTENIVFTKGATEALNLVAYGLSGDIKAGDEIIISQMEHHSNIVPWQLVAEATGAQVDVVRLNDAGEVTPAAFGAALTERTRICAFAHVSNSLGTVLPVAELTSWITPEPHSPCPSPSAISCTTSPSPASAGAPLAWRSSRAVVPSHARAIDLSTAASCTAGSCGKGSSVSSS